MLGNFQPDHHPPPMADTPAGHTCALAPSHEHVHSAKRLDCALRLATPPTTPVPALRPRLLHGAPQCPASRAGASCRPPPSSTCPSGQHPPPPSILQPAAHHRESVHMPVTWPRRHPLAAVRAWILVRKTLTPTPTWYSIRLNRCVCRCVHVHVMEPAAGVPVCPAARARSRGEAAGAHRAASRGLPARPGRVAPGRRPSSPAVPGPGACQLQPPSLLATCGGPSLPPLTPAARAGGRGRESAWAVISCTAGKRAPDTECWLGQARVAAFRAALIPPCPWPGSTAEDP